MHSVPSADYCLSVTTTSAPPDLGQIRGELSLWRDHLGARNLSPTTIKNYLGAGEVFAAFLERNDFPTAVEEITPRTVEAFIRHELERGSASSAATRYRALQQLFRYLLADAVISKDPMAGMTPPKLEEKQVETITDDDLRKLFKVMAGQGFEDRRDTAICRILLSTGCRVGELVGMMVDAVDFQLREIRVMGKGRKERNLPLSPKANAALVRYWRERTRRRDADSPALWLGVRGPMTESGIAQLLRRRARQAKIANIHPHQFRHTFSHQFLSNGGNEHDLAKLNGWKSLQMVGRYAETRAVDRAKQAHRRLAPGENI